MRDVLAQLRVMARFGGAGLIPSGPYHQELPTTVTDRRCDAPPVLPDLLPPMSPDERRTRLRVRHRTGPDIEAPR